jgi:signal peptidase II
MKHTFVKFSILMFFLVSGCSLDLKTKELAKAELKEHSISVIDHYFDLNYTENNAIAFGFLGSLSKGIRLPLIFFLTISATLFGFYVIWRIRYKKFRYLLPFFILLGGAYGNIIDRLFNGYVTDFFYAHYFFACDFPVFNVADVLVNIGIILVIIQWKSFQRIFEEVFEKKTILN